jgi:hypothetical protein
VKLTLELYRWQREQCRRLFKVAIALETTGVVSGEFGMSEAYEQKRTEVLGWLTDPDERVQEFAKWYIANLERLRDGAEASGGGGYRPAKVPSWRGVTANFGNFLKTPASLQVSRSGLYADSASRDP